MNLSENLWNIKKSLENHTYQISGYNKFMIFDPEEREIQALSYYNRIVFSMFYAMRFYALLLIQG